MLPLISFLMVAYSYFLIRTNLPHLPTRIPTHFSLAGMADGWGSPETLWVLWGAQILTCATILIVPYIGQRYPSVVHLGSSRLSDYSPAQRARVIPMLKQMVGWMGIVMNVFFVWLLDQIIHAATLPRPQIRMLGPLALLLGGMLVTLFYYLAKFRQVAEEPGEPGRPDEFTP